MGTDATQKTETKTETATTTTTQSSDPRDPVECQGSFETTPPPAPAGTPPGSALDATPEEHALTFPKTPTDLTASTTTTALQRPAPSLMVSLAEQSR